MRDIRTTDYHTAGEPFRIVTDGVPEIPGTTVLQRRGHAQRDEQIDAVRRLLVNEPRGHADMYGCFVVPPDDEGAHFGVLFWHKDGYSTACGHGTIALGVWAVRSGLVNAAPDGETEVVIDVPSGRVTAAVTCVAGEVRDVSFRNVPAYVLGEGITVDTSRGPVRADVSYGGAIYASVDASALGLSVDPEHYGDLLALGREVKWKLDGTEWARHPSEPRLDGIYGTILFEDLGRRSDGPHQRNITVFADGEVDRSPCGSGTSARIALLASSGQLAPDQVLTHDSVVGTRFLGRVVRELEAEGRPAYVSEVRGMAYRTGEHHFVLEADDPVGLGFALR
ncbi:proline racemase family protein [Micromonospora avicenniae]|uniref:Proline racemase/trans-L-3-hydroxyproline dehydratase n=1 Tax=Micromonospora avicenniae TaxID=1198245 RepID=A0A1N7F559_9ACTN|nr:proline racemase family protein [Micromonospora avicenniae]SIR95454.1 proline racemase/trans-L-3-hydroxyproline dehydratase [Micromonospora avicenniae]